MAVATPPLTGSRPDLKPSAGRERDGGGDGETETGTGQGRFWTPNVLGVDMKCLGVVEDLQKALDLLVLDSD